jgi:hypothetical protein
VAYFVEFVDPVLNYVDEVNGLTNDDREELGQQ